MMSVGLVLLCGFSNGLVIIGVIMCGLFVLGSVMLGIELCVFSGLVGRFCGGLSIGLCVVSWFVFISCWMCMNILV